MATSTALRPADPRRDDGGQGRRDRVFLRASGGVPALLPGEAITLEHLMDQTAITTRSSTVSAMSGETIKKVLEDVADNLFNPDPYLQQGGDMVRVGGLQYTCRPGCRDGQPDQRHAPGRQADRAEQDLQGGGLGAGGRRAPAANRSGMSLPATCASARSCLRFGSTSPSSRASPTIPAWLEATRTRAVMQSFLVEVRRRVFSRSASRRLSPNAVNQRIGARQLPILRYRCDVAPWRSPCGCHAPLP